MPSFGGDGAWLLVVGLAPGRRGANRTARPFTGDHAGLMLYGTLLRLGLATGRYDPDGHDDLLLVGCRVTNAVRCVPPGNRPTPSEVATCNRFLASELAALPALRAIVALGVIAHDAVLAALGLRRRSHPFAHGARHPLADGVVLADSYHCSRQNTNTGRLTTEMFVGVFAPLLGGHGL